MERDVSASARRRIAVLVVLLVAAPFASAAKVSARVLTPDDLAEGIPADAVVRPATWKAAAEGDALVLAGATAGEATLLLEGVDVFAFRAKVEEGALVFLVDRREAARYTGSGEDDFALAPGRHELAWRFEPSTKGAAFELELLGMEVLSLPVVGPVVDRLAACAGASIDAVLRAVVGVEASALRVTWDGAELPVSASSRLVGYDVETRVRAAVPPSSLTPGEHGLRIRLVDGDAITELLDTVVRVVDGGVGLLWPPSGWIYDRTPLVQIAALGCAESTSIRLFIDGEEVGDATQGLHRSWSFGRPLAFRETHTYEFVVSFGSGVVRHYGGTFTEGLDVLAYELRDARVVYASMAGAAAFDAHAGVSDPLFAEGRTSVQLPSRLVSVEGPRVHVVAEYAPLEILCSEGAQRVCSPYGGGSPDYLTHHGYLSSALLQGGKTRTQVPGAGQAAAAAWFSHVETPLPAALLRLEAAAGDAHARADAQAE